MHDADRMAIRGRKLMPVAVPVLIKKVKRPYRHAEVK